MFQARSILSDCYSKPPPLLYKQKSFLSSWYTCLGDELINGSNACVLGTYLSQALSLTLETWVNGADLIQAWWWWTGEMSYCVNGENLQLKSVVRGVLNAEGEWRSGASGSHSRDCDASTQGPSTTFSLPLLLRPVVLTHSTEGDDSWLFSVSCC